MRVARLALASLALAPPPLSSAAIANTCPGGTAVAEYKGQALVGGAVHKLYDVIGARAAGGHGDSHSGLFRNPRAARVSRMHPEANDTDEEVVQCLHGSGRGVGEVCVVSWLGHTIAVKGSAK